MIKFLDIQKITAKYHDEIHQAIDEVVDSGWYLQGEANARFEKHFAEYIGTDCCVGCANGLDALIWIFRAYIEAGIMFPGDEVTAIMQSCFSFIWKESAARISWSLLFYQ